MVGITMALEKGATIEIVERMMAVRRELQSERAKGQFDQAMSDFQMRCPMIVKNKSVFNKDGRSVRYKYATLDSIVAQTKELLRELGFSYAIFADVDVAAKCVKAKCRVTHSGGHSTESEFAVPIDPDGFMNAQQKFGSAMTFAKRYAFTNVFGILTSDEDTDANTHKEKPAGPNPLHGTSAAAPSNSEKLMKKALIDATRKIHRVDAGYALDLEAIQALTQWLVGEGLILDTENLGDLSGDRLVKAVEKAKGLR